MRRSPLLSLLPFLLLLLLCLPKTGQTHPHILQLDSGQEIDYQALLDELSSVQVIHIGESHDHAGHHRMQAEIIRGLVGRGLKVAVGLEMFRVDAQAALDSWTGQELDVVDFEAVFNQNWSWWPEYRPLFLSLREQKLPLLALNISRDITRQVARNGFGSLTAEQLKGIAGAPCIVDPTYAAFIRRALGEHEQEDDNFTFFCEAQLLWDIAMARHLADFLAKNPQHKIVVLAGSGHSWKYGIPAQLCKYPPVKLGALGDC